MTSILLPQFPRRPQKKLIDEWLPTFLSQAGPREPIILK